MIVKTKDPCLYIELDSDTKPGVFTEIKELDNGWKDINVVVSYSRWQRILRSIKSLFVRRKSYSFSVNYIDTWKEDQSK